MAIEFIGMIHHRHGSEIHPPGSLIFDRGYIRDFAQAAEAVTSSACWWAISPTVPTGSCCPRTRRRTPSGWGSCSPTGPASSRRHAAVTLHTSRDIAPHRIDVAAPAGVARAANRRSGRIPFPGDGPDAQHGSDLHHRNWMIEG